MIRLLRLLVPASVLTLLLSELALILACYTVASLFTTFLGPYDYLITENNYWKLLLLAGLIALGLYFQDLYTEMRVVSRLLLVQQVSLAVGAALLIMAFLGFLRPSLLLGRWLMLAGSVTVIVVLPLWRMIYWRYVVVALRSERVLLLGSSPLLADIAHAVLAKPEFGYTLLGYLAEPATPSGTEQPASPLPPSFPVPCLGRVDDVRQVASVQHPTRIVVGMAERRHRLPIQDLLELRFSGVVIEDAADTYEFALHRVSSSKIQPSQLIFTSQLGPHRRAIAFHNFYSFLFALIGLVVFSPAMLIAALVVKLSSPGPILYRQQRMGLNGRMFHLYKFRSMTSDAEAESGAVWAARNDPRVTRAGRWLRKLRVDELPQFWNVVRGDMGIVGPRPERPEFVEFLAARIPYYRLRLSVKPGITGWAQINHKYADSAADAMVKLEYDLYYIKHVALALDLYIIFHTVKVMLLRRGAQ